MGATWWSLEDLEAEHLATRGDHYGIVSTSCALCVAARANAPAPGQLEAATVPALPAWAEPGAVPDPGRCRSCQAPIWWVRTVRGKRAPMDADGGNHFATCPQADAWRR